MTQPTNGNGDARQAPEPTLISVILDRSGSMVSICEPTIKGFNDFVHTQQEHHEGGRAFVSLTQFDHRYEVNFVGEPIANVPDLDMESYVPRGMTALYDAIGRTIHEVEAWTRKHNWQERVLVLIITDGQENSSKEYTFEAVRTLIAQKQEAGWNFAYMGANQDSYAVASSMNIRADFTANYAATAAGTAANYARLSAATWRYRTAKTRGPSARNFFDVSVQRTDADAAGKLAPQGASSATDSDAKPPPQPHGRTFV